MRFFTLSFFSRLYLLIGTILCISFHANADTHSWQDINWLDYDEARALNTEKPIFVFAELHFCSACKKMKAEVFNQAELIDLLNTSFVPVNMKSLGLFPNKLDDLQDNEGETLTMMGSPALVVVYKDQYKLVYGFHDVSQLSKMLRESLAQIAKVNS